MKLSLLTLCLALPCLAQATLTASGTVAIEVTTPLPAHEAVTVEGQVQVALSCSASESVTYALEEMTLRFAQAPGELDGSTTLDSTWRSDPSWSFSKEISHFGARLVPHIKFACMQGDHQHFSPWTEAVGAPITIAPLVLLPHLDGNTVSAIIFAEPRGSERISLRVWGGGTDVAHTFTTAEEAMKGLALPAGVTGMVHLTATLEPYDAVSNVVDLEIETPVPGSSPPDEAPPEEPAEPKTGCSATAAGLAQWGALALLRRRRQKE